MVGSDRSRDRRGAGANLVRRGEDELLINSLSMLLGFEPESSRPLRPALWPVRVAPVLRAELVLLEHLEEARLARGVALDDGREAR